MGRLRIFVGGIFARHQTPEEDPTCRSMPSTAIGDPLEWDLRIQVLTGVSMTDSRRMTTDRFYGGLSNRLRNLRSMLAYVQDDRPARDQLNAWVIANTRANSEDAVSHHLSFLDAIELIELSKSECRLASYGQAWLADQDPETLYDALSSGVKGFDTILEALEDEALTDEEIMNLLVSEFDEAEMTKPGPATRHREWLQVLGFVSRDGTTNRLTDQGRELLEGELGAQPRRAVLDDENLSWLEATRSEIERYRDQTGESVITLKELYEFSERRLANRWPENNNVRAKIRQQVQDLRNEGHLTELDERGAYRIEIEDDVSEAESELEATLESDPELTEASSTFTQSRRRARDRAFTRLVKEAYNQTCAICGSNRKSPQGNPEVEAAHIYPKEENGVDDVRNGIALCKLHHWAFDTGWLSITDDRKLLVRDAADTSGYHEFKQLEGDSLSRPNDEEKWPHPMFLQKHREMHGFE